MTFFFVQGKWRDKSVSFIIYSLLMCVSSIVVELVRNLVAHGDAREGKWRGNWRMEWVASTLTPPPNVVYPTLLKLMRTPRLPAVDWTDAPTDLNGLVRFGERRNLVSARVSSRSARAIHYDENHGLELREVNVNPWKRGRSCCIQCSRDIIKQRLYRFLQVLSHSKR